MEIIIPKRSKGRPSKAKNEAYARQMEAFAGAIKQIASTLDFDVSARGWCYLLEDLAGVSKGDFDVVDKVINHCRRSGLLPLDICAEDGDRVMENIDYISYDDIDERAIRIIDHAVNDAALRYSPYDVWENQSYYVEMLVEKVDLKGIFRPVCQKYHVPFANAKGWTSLNQRGGIMERFKEREARGHKCVLLYCGDHDPGGLNIANEFISNCHDLSDAVGWRPDDVIIDRFGLTYEFIEANGIPWINNLNTSAPDKTDANGNKVKALPLDHPRHKDHYKPYVQRYIKEIGVRKVEANALVTRVDAGRRMCEEAILKYVDPVAVDKWIDDTNIIRNDLKEAIINEMSKYKRGL